MLLFGMPSAAALVQVVATVETDPVVGAGDAADDPAIWIHPADPSLSTVIGTDKTGGGLGVYDLAGHQIQFDATVKPNNVDLRYNFPLGGASVALVGFTNKRDASIGTYAVDPLSRQISSVAARVLKPTVGTKGFCMYRSPSSGRYYAFVVSNGGGVEQWELFDNGAGKVDGALVRSFVVNTTSPTGTAAEGCVADDTYGALYVGEERAAIWRYGAEPDAGSARTLVDVPLPTGHFKPDVEGLAIYYRSDGSGYLIASSQGSSEYVVYDRVANQYIGTFKIVAGTLDNVSGTDGIDVTNFPLGSGFPEGMFVVQDGSNPGANQNFKYVPWGAIARAFSPALAIDTSWDPRLVGGGSGGNRAPLVNAGPDQTIVPGQTAVLDGSVADDGLPSGTLTTGWTIDPPTVAFADPSAVDTTATFPDVGTYVLQLGADDGELQASDSMTVVVSDSVTVEARVATSSDDAEESASGSVSLSSSDLQLVFDGSNQTVGLRFTGVGVPRGATIVKAYVQFEADEVNTGTTSLLVRGQAADNPLTFTTASGNISSRPKTANGVAWLPQPWSIVQEQGARQQTPDLSPVIQEIVNRQLWAPGNTLALIITGTGERTAESFNGTFAPLLHIEYTTGGPPPNQPPVVSAGSDQTVTFPDAATLNGSVTDDDQPNPPGAVTALWTQTSGLGTVSFGDPTSPSTTATFSEAGTYVLRLTGDDSLLTNSDEVTVVSNPVGGGTTLTIPVAASSEDAEEAGGSTKTMYLTSGDLEMVRDNGADQTVGLRFTGIAVPPGATILNAYVQFTTMAVPTTTTSLTIQGEAADNPGTFTSALGNISSRARSSASVTWPVPVWTTIGSAGPDQQTPNLAPIVQELIGRPGWANGNAIVLIITGTGRRVGYTFNSGIAPVLHLQYS